MKFNIKITQIREGFVEIEAEDHNKALDIAELLYRVEGRELPEMEDGYPLQFRVEYPQQVEKDPVPITGEVTREDVEKYLISQGHPNPSKSQIDEFFGPENKAMYDEAVRNQYSMYDLDRWFHLKEVLGEPISFHLAMFIDNALWTEEYEAMEISSPAELLDTPEGILKGNIEQIIKDFATNHESNIEWWGNQDLHPIRREDADVLSRVFGHMLTVELEQKQSLSSLIQSADSRSSSGASAHVAQPQNKEPIR